MTQGVTPAHDEPMLDGSDLAILIPLWHRPARVAPIVNDVLEATPRARVVLIMSEDDPEVLAEAGHWQELASKITDPDKRPRLQLVMVPWAGGIIGDYARKINYAVTVLNLDSANPIEEWLFLGADDLHFWPGWYDRARARAAMYPAVQVIGTNDLGNRRTRTGRHSTHSLVKRTYLEQGTIDDPTKLLHEGYEHEFVDDEFVRTAEHRGVFAHERNAWVEHLHPHWNKAPTDAIYDDQDRRMIQGRQLFDERRPLWGGAGQG